MKSVFSRGLMQTCLRRAPWIMVAALITALNWGASPALGIWLPWAKEEQKITRRLNDIWTALVAKDKVTARKYLLGNAVDPFINQELDIIKTMKIRKINCRADKIQLDKVKGEFAFVEFAKICTLESGQEVTNRFLRVFRKVGDDWKLIADANQNPKKKTNAKADEQATKDFFDLVMEKLPGAESRQ
jgi:hypothetical protein